jgi:hypothetical protein
MMIWLKMLSKCNEFVSKKVFFHLFEEIQLKVLLSIILMEMMFIMVYLMIILIWYDDCIISFCRL